MPEHNHLNLYVDDSGSRVVKRHPGDNPRFDYFALGGLVILDEHKPAAQALYDDFCQKWKITVPLHSVKIRHSKDDWRMLRDPTFDKEAFFSDLHAMMRVPGLYGIASTVHRPGYLKRYSEVYSDSKWLLCNTVFPILIERAVRYAIELGTKLRIHVERSGESEDRLIKRYIEELKSKGMPFNQETSEKYKPLTADDFAATICELEFKDKRTRLLQVADLLLYAIARSRYEPTYRAYQAMIADKMLIDCLFSAEDAIARGSKFSCFDLIETPTDKLESCILNSEDV
ncbi:DUF3800 domain-containing protein [Rhizobium lusitanum]|uniref:DUF3800 domain-containing protein n=1 Tax=Rhizobium lusitanum TaxID=293958 RepID=A0A1C3XIL4_9HYPH|nr:DUF3800 domain-containing protein [Rhizobium lusitanum]SCB51906.1 Protein of unknown function [Rhizobium lusitanum]